MATPVIHSLLKPEKPHKVYAEAVTCRWMISIPLGASRCGRRPNPASMATPSFSCPTETSVRISEKVIGGHADLAVETHTVDIPAVMDLPVRSMAKVEHPLGCGLKSNQD